MLLWPERGVRYCGMGCGRCIVWGFEWLELTHAFAQYHTCAIAGSSGGLLCWGNNGNGQVPWGVLGGFVVGERDVGRVTGGFVMWL